MSARNTSLESRYNSVAPEGDLGASEFGSIRNRRSILKSARLEKLIIIGDDDRTAVTEINEAYKSICLLRIRDKNDRMYHGTGFMISQRCVITAGHCVYFNNDWVQEITVVPGAAGHAEPNGSSKSVVFRSVRGWIKDKNPNFDYGAVILPDDTLYKNVGGVFDYKAYENEEEVELVGYPTDKALTQWKSVGKIKSTSKFRLFYELDTLEGNSGSPVYIRKDNKLCAVGVHSYGDTPNYSIRISDQMVERWKEWSVL
jgi:glutamyl endopeptidase